jgi:hypothetical protein
MLKKEFAMIKRGTVREDGKIYYPFNQTKGIWLTKKQYDNRCQRVKEYQKRCYNMYLQTRKRKRKFGEYCVTKNLYFIRVSSSGKEVWKSKEYYLRIREDRKNYQKKYYSKSSLLPKTNLKFGDQNPNNPKQFVLRKTGNKIIFGTANQLKDRRQILRNIYKKRNLKYKIRRCELIRKYKRGDINPINQKIFWYYSNSGNEIWLTKEEFDFRLKKYIEKRAYYNQKRKAT